MPRGDGSNQIKLGQQDAPVTILQERTSATCALVDVLG